jgi:hypothetical protein
MRLMRISRLTSGALQGRVTDEKMLAAAFDFENRCDV